MKRLVLGTLLLLAAPALASVESGQAKWRAGDWDGAVAEWVAPAARGDADALFNMGQAYRLGRGVPMNARTAIEHYRRAADKGHVPATASLGISLWQEGRKTEALTHLRTAAERGDLRASYVLGVATFEGDVAPRNPALGYAWVVRAREGGLALASGQAARMATRMSAEDRARGDAAAAALAGGQPVAVVLAEMSSPPARPPEEPVQLAQADEADEDAAETQGTRTARAEPARPEPARPARPPRGAAQPGAADAAKGAGRAGEEKAEATRGEDRSAARGEEKAGEKAGEKAEARAWKVQLGAYANERAARTAWATLVSQSATLLKGEKPLYAPRGGLVRLQLGPFEERREAADLCAKLSAAGRPCFVTR